MSAAVADVLRRARALIEVPERWCQHVAIDEARDARCAFNALCESEPSGIAIGSRKAVLAAVGLTRRDSLADWNDAPERTHAEVLAAFDRAIASEEASP